MQKPKKTIVVVDDIPHNLYTASKLLSKQYEVLAVPSGAILFQILEKVIPDLILLDVEMPEMDGFEVINLLKEAEETASIPILFYTSKDAPEYKLKGLGLGAADYLIKPMLSNLLIERIEAHLHHEINK